MATDKRFLPAELPTKDEALTMAAERDEWAKGLRDRDCPGSAWEFELAALLLRFYADKDRGLKT